MGATEAYTLYNLLHGKTLPRPTIFHDIQLLLKKFDIEVSSVHIDRPREGVYPAIVAMRQGDKVLTMNTRISDALAIALVSGCQPTATNEVMEEFAYPELKTASSDFIDIHAVEDSFVELFAGDNMPEPDPDEIQEQMTADLELYKELLQDAIKKENYEYANELQKAIKRIESKRKESN